MSVSIHPSTRLLSLIRGQILASCASLLDGLSNADTQSSLPDSQADLTDADFFLDSLDQTMFPGTSGLEAHNGFLAEQAKYISHV